jgi:hypothetical protein
VDNILQSNERLTAIANRCGTDKGSLANGYTCIYEMLFGLLRDRPIRLLEIGLAMGGPELDQSADRRVTDVPSIRMWRDFFPHAHIYGLDISDFSAFQTEWFTFFRADCSDSGALQSIARKGIEFDIIIDDGSHASFHQQLTFSNLFPCLKSGGLYVIEDLDWQPTVYEASLPPAMKTADLLFMFKHALNAPPFSDVDSIGTVLLFDEDSLIDLRKRYNYDNSVVPLISHYADRTSHGIARFRSHLRRIADECLAIAQAIAGRPRKPRRLKLAVLQKC